jgi:plastocyanin
VPWLRYVTVILALGLSGTVLTSRTATASRSRTGIIQGRLTIGATAARPPRPAIADLGEHRSDVVDRRRAVVYLKQAPREAFDELPAGRARMDQHGEQFVPRVLAVTVGTIVDFPNTDTTFHNVFSLARTNTFDLGRYPPHRSGSVKFDHPGVVPVFCDIHSNMSAYILVFNHPFFALTDTDGRYAISGVPPGSYALEVWSELGTVEPRRVVVGDGEIVEMNFLVGRGE